MPINPDHHRKRVAIAQTWFDALLGERMVPHPSCKKCFGRGFHILEDGTLICKCNRLREPYMYVGLFTYDGSSAAFCFDSVQQANTFIQGVGSIDSSEAWAEHEAILREGEKEEIERDGAIDADTKLLLAAIDALRNNNQDKTKITYYNTLAMTQAKEAEENNPKGKE